MRTLWGMVGTVLVATCGLMVVGCSNNSPDHSESGCATLNISAPCRLLFIGNSYTYVNNLPAMFARLARAGGRTAETGILAEGGATLADHIASPETEKALSSARWNVVVLQEQSEIPSIERFRQAEMYPAVRRLVRMTRDAGAQPMLYLTWAHQDGWPQDGLIGYTSMQSAIDDGYLVIARELHATVAPVGYAWAKVLKTGASSGLWQSDGSHPTVKGTYLAACVFYATVFRESPNGLGYRAGLPKHEASELQAIATNVVLDVPSA
jgi:hypothetical protein